MIELTVKTLDSQNHKFSIPDDVTVKQFKEKIADTINVPVDSQRLIYCGRVLQDDKNLSEYDVNGKVIHLVQRAPPQPSPNNNAANGRRPQPPNANHRRIHYHHHHYHRQPRFDGNTMYFGTMAIPADLIEEQGIGIRATLPQGFSRTQTRIALAQQMLSRAQDVLTRLENPDASLPDSETSNEDLDNSSSSSGGESSSSIGGAAGGNSTGAASHATNGQANPFSGSIMQAAQAATAAAIAAAVSAVQAAGLPNITIMRGPPGSESADGGSSEDLGRSNGADEQARASEGFQNSSTSAPTEEPNLAEDSNRRAIEAPRTTALAEVLENLAQTNARLQPFLQQYQNLMQNDPAADTNGETLESMQRTFNSVSEVMHYLSHTYHAMSDIMCDFTQTPPRNLRSRPLVIQHSAVLQAGIPIQAQINVMGNRNASNAGSRQQSPSESSTPTSTASGVGASQTNETPSPPEAAPQTGTPQRPQSRPSRSQAPSGLPPVVSISPGNVEFFMELGQAGATIDSIQATVVTNTNGNSNASGSEGNSTNATGSTQQQSFTWPRPPSAEFIENLMQAMAGQMIMGRGTGNTATVTINGSLGGGANARSRSTPPTTAATTSATTSASASANATTSAGGNAGGGQNSQARGNTATHPTTSTQTRSTSRPHVQLAPAALQGLGANSFDPFLPCNSHHLSSPRRRVRPQQHAATNTVPEQQAQASAPPAAEPTPAETPDQQNMSRLDLLFAFMNHWLGSGSGSRDSSASAPESEASFSSGDSTSTGTSRPGSTFTATSFSDEALLDQLNVPLELSWLGLLNQLRQGSSQNEGATSMLYQGSPTVADFLQTAVPNYSHSEGESFLTDLIMLVARNITFENMIALSVGHSRALDQMQPQLNDFVLQRVLLGQLPTQEHISNAVSRIITEIQPPADILDLMTSIRQDVDLMASINKFCQVRITELIRLILTKSNPGVFGRSLMSLCSVILTELTSLLLHCCDGGEREVEAMFRTAMRHLSSGVPPELQRLTINSCLTCFRNYVTVLNARSINVEQFIVYRLSGPSADSSAVSEKPSSSPKEAAASEPMETESAVKAPAEATVLANGVETANEAKRANEADDVDMEIEPQTWTRMQAEPWPSSIPSEWVPIIARDSVRQRRQSSQPPFSDVYLAGMPCKRRKVVTNSKRQGNVSQIISERVQNAVEASGVGAGVFRDSNGGSPGPEQLGQAAASDLALQQAYREHVLLCLRQRVRADPDFTPERFPNTASYLSK